MASPELVNQLLAANGSALPADQIPALKSALTAAKVSDNTVQAAFADLKNPTTMLIIAWFGGSLGIDRFMLGQTGLGVAKLLTCGGCGIWSLIDLFTACGRTREYNAQKVNEAVAGL